MADRAGGARDLGTRCELPGPVVLEQVRRSEDLCVLRQVADLVAGAADAAARREHPAVREEQSSRVILACHSLRREGGPLAGRRVPPLRVVDTAVHVDERRPGRVAARRQHAPVGKQRQVVLATAESHRRGGGHLRRTCRSCRSQPRSALKTRRRPQASCRRRRRRGSRSRG